MRSDMRVCIIPSWCPTDKAPHAGAFFFTQAHALAEQRREWEIAICRFDLARSRFPRNPLHWPRFIQDVITTPRVHHEKANSGLHIFTVYLPYMPRMRGKDAWHTNAYALARHAHRALKAFGHADIIHAQSCYPAGAAMHYLRQDVQSCYVLTEHLGPFPPASLCEADGTPSPVVTKAYAASDAVSAVSGALGERIKTFGLATDVTILPNSIASDYGSIAKRTPKGPVRFLNIANPSHAKGTDILLHAFAALDADAELHIVGSGHERVHFEGMARTLGIADKVKFIGHVTPDALHAHYHACDALVVASQSETFSLVCIEALAHGKPVIATRCGGPEDIINEANGILIPVSDSAALQTAMARMILEHSHYVPDKLRADVMARFSANTVIPRIESWYAAALSA
ncbi:MAG: hypothetical protein C0436_03195 [Alphaproteobacteria bacterium]|nr:hypothetical protein [Alphaproteobacteria bacterium]